MRELNDKAQKLYDELIDKINYYLDIMPKSKEKLIKTLDDLVDELLNEPVRQVTIRIMRKEK